MSRSSSGPCRLFWLFAVGATLADPVGVPLDGADASSARHPLAGASIPAFFVPNAGQTDPRVRFQTSGPGGIVSFGSSEILVTSFAKVVSPREPQNAAGLDVTGRDDRQRESRALNVRHLRFEGASPAASVVGIRPLPGAVHILRGADPARWKTHLPIYGGIAYRDLYPGVDLEIEPSGRGIRGTFVLGPDADASRIRWRWDGAGGEQPPVAGADGRLSLSFSPESSDAVRALAADPPLYSTYYGGNGDEIGYAVAVDADGAAYVTGSTLSTDLPTVGPIDGTCGTDGACNGGAKDVFVAKLDPTKSGAASLVYATYLGGSGDDVGVRIAVDGSKNAYVAGIARAGFPTTANAYQQTFGSATGVGADAFLSKLAPDGASLLYSTYFGGSNGDGAWGVAVDGSGGAWLTGETFSNNFPTTTGAYDTSCGSDGNCDGTGDAYVARLDTTKSGSASLVFSTFLGGSGEDQGFGVALGPASTVYLTGRTASTDLPHPGAYQASNGDGLFDAFVAKMSADGSSLLYATYLGGSGYDDGYTVAVDGSGRACLVGTTSSGVPGTTVFPTTAGALQGSFGGVFDAYFARIDPGVAGAGSLTYSTYLGGSGDDEGFGLALDGGTAILTGFTASTDFPVKVCSPQGASGGGYDAFLSRINPSAPGSSALVASGYYGGLNTDAGFGVALDPDGSVVFVGQTSSTDFPTLHAYAGTLAGQTDAFVTKLSLGGCPPTSFFTVTPCRAVDTRNAAGPYGGPALSGGTDRAFVLAGHCGVPLTARGISLNVTVTAPAAAGDLRLYPAGTLRPLVSTINYRAGQTRANNAVAALGAAGDVAVRCDQATGTVHVIVDVNGYFQ